MWKESMHCPRGCIHMQRGKISWFLGHRTPRPASFERLLPCICPHIRMGLIDLQWRTNFQLYWWIQNFHQQFVQQIILLTAFLFEIPVFRLVQCKISTIDCHLSQNSERTGQCIWHHDLGYGWRQLPTKVSGTCVNNWSQIKFSAKQSWTSHSGMVKSRGDTSDHRKMILQSHTFFWSTCTDKCFSRFYIVTQKSFQSFRTPSPGHSQIFTTFSKMSHLHLHRQIWTTRPEDVEDQRSPFRTFQLNSVEPHQSFSQTLSCARPAKKAFTSSCTLMCSRSRPEAWKRDPTANHRHPHSLAANPSQISNSNFHLLFLQAHSGPFLNRLLIKTCKCQPVRYSRSQFVQG